MQKEFSKEKILSHLEELNRFKEGIDFFPISMEFSLTNRCNANCIWCNDRKIRGLYNKDIDSEAVIRTLENMKLKDVKAVTFEGGGEPTLHPDFNRIIIGAYLIGLDIGIITNGINIDNKVNVVYIYDGRPIEQVSRARIILESCKWIRISLDAGTKKTYKLLKGTDKFDKVMKNIEMLCKLKKQLRSKCKIGISYIEHDKNISEIVPIIKRLDKIGADYIQLKPLIKEGKFEETDYVKSFFTPGTKIKVIQSGYDYSKDYNYCYAHLFSGQIDAGGNVNLCCNLGYKKRLNFGNINKQSFSKIWLGKKRQRIIKKTLSKRFKERCPVCRFDNTNKLLNSLKEPANNFI